LEAEVPRRQVPVSHREPPKRGKKKKKEKKKKKKKIHGLPFDVEYGVEEVWEEMPRKGG
jgi:hypothetical protein